MTRAEFEEFLAIGLARPDAHPLWDEVLANIGHDILGEYYEKKLLSPNTGSRPHEQVFTPKEVVKHMNETTLDILQKQFPDRLPDFFDPCCGSGRFALDLTQRGINSRIYCLDIDLVCVQMCIINLALVNVNCCEVAHGDALDSELWRVWQLRKGERVSFIQEIEPDHSYWYKWLQQTQKS